MQARDGGGGGGGGRDYLNESRSNIFFDKVNFGSLTRQSFFVNKKTYNPA